MADQRQALTALIVDDDEEILRLLKMMVGKMGIEPITTMSPFEALQILENKAASINLLITDVVMPEIFGDKLAERAIQLGPDIKILLLSGRVNDPWSNEIEHHHGTAFLRKPFRFHELKDAINALLHGEQHDESITI